MIELTNTVPILGRILHFFHPATGWQETACLVVAPATIAQVNFQDGSMSVGPAATVKIFLDRSNESPELEVLRSRDGASPFVSVPVFDSLTNEQREEMKRSNTILNGVGCWCEWPPSVHPAMPAPHQPPATTT